MGHYFLDTQYMEFKAPLAPLFSLIRPWSEDMRQRAAACGTVNPDGQCQSLEDNNDDDSFKTAIFVESSQLNNTNDLITCSEDLQSDSDQNRTKISQNEAICDSFEGQNDVEMKQNDVEMKQNDAKMEQKKAQNTEKESKKKSKKSKKTSASRKKKNSGNSHNYSNIWDL